MEGLQQELKLGQSNSALKHSICIFIQVKTIFMYSIKNRSVNGGKIYDCNSKIVYPVLL